MKVIELRVENFKRVRAVTVHPHDFNQIQGRNEAGKTSVIDAIQWAMQGAKAGFKQVVRQGCDKATVGVDLGESYELGPDLRVTRTMTSGGTPGLKISTREGAKVERSGQETLDRFYGYLSFDPLQFGRMKPKERAEELRRLTGCDTVKLDLERGQVFAERTEVNRQVKALETNIAALKIPPQPDGVGQETDLAQFADKKAQVVAVNAANAAKRQAAQTADDRVRAWATEVAKLEKQLAEAQEKLARAREAHRLLDSQAVAAVDAPVEAIEAEIAKAKTHNAGVRAAQDAMARHKEAKAAERAKMDERSRTSDRAAELSRRLDEIDQEKRDVLAAAKFPYPGMSVDGDEVFVDGVPYSQLSSAQEIKVGVALGAAFNPDLKICLVRLGSLLDEGGMRDLREAAQTVGVQVWVERVAETDLGTGVFIEDGQAR